MDSSSEILSDILCHRANFFSGGLTQVPEMKKIEFPATSFISLQCGLCEKRYCLVVREGSDIIELHEIDDEIEIGSIVANMLGPELGINLDEFVKVVRFQ